MNDKQKWKYPKIEFYFDSGHIYFLYNSFIHFGHNLNLISHFENLTVHRILFETSVLHRQWPQWQNEMCFISFSNEQKNEYTSIPYNMTKSTIRSWMSLYASGIHFVFIKWNELHADWKFGKHNDSIMFIYIAETTTCQHTFLGNFITSIANERDSTFSVPRCFFSKLLLFFVEW